MLIGLKNDCLENTLLQKDKSHQYTCNIFLIIKNTIWIANISRKDERNGCSSFKAIKKYSHVSKNSQPVLEYTFKKKSIKIKFSDEDMQITWGSGTL